VESFADDAKGLSKRRKLALLRIRLLVQHAIPGFIDEPGPRQSVRRAKTSAAWASSTVSGHVSRGAQTDRDEQDVEQDDGYGQPQDDGHVFLL
jgi:hypothetical protein